MTNNHYYKKESTFISLKRLKAGFNLVVLKKGLSYSFGNYSDSVLVFIQTGKVRVIFEMYKEYLFGKNEFIFLKNTDYQFDALRNTKIILLKMDDQWVSFYEILRKDISTPTDIFCYSLSSFIIHPKLELFLNSEIQKISKNSRSIIYNPGMERELEALLIECYSRKALLKLFCRLSDDIQDFYQFIIKNYSKCRGAMELIILSGLSQSTFNRKFRKLFGESFYQWLLEKRADEIYYKLTESNEPLETILREYSFTDASHFNRFCKSKFGLTPSELRKNHKSDKLPSFIL